MPISPSRIAVLVIATLLGCTDATAPEPGLSTLSGRIVFQSNRSGRFHIWTTRPDDSEMERFTDDTTRVGAPGVSPDGRTLVVSDGYRLIGIDVATRRTRVVADIRNVSSHDWNAATGLILVSWYNPDSGSRDVSLVDPATGLVTPLLSSDAEETNADWSPDGQWIAFASTRDSPNGVQLYVVRPDGSGLRRLTSMEGVVDVVPDWSPDGSRLAFRRLALDDGSERLAFVTPAGDDTTFMPGIEDLQTVRFSPDGSRLVVDRNTPGGRTLWLMNIDGSELVQLTPDGALDANPRWVP